MSTDVLYRLWGKTNELDRPKNADTSVDWDFHPAICHMIDVGYVAERWLDLAPWIMKRFSELAPGIEHETLRRIIITLVALHDLGKVHRSFQSKSADGWATGYGADGRKREGDNGHGFDHGLHTARIIRRLARESLPAWKPYCAAIDAVAVHHGKIYQVDELGYRPMMNGWETEMAIGMVSALSELFGMPAETPPAVDQLSTPGFVMLLAGFTAVADWLGSQSDTFTFTKVTDPESTREYLASLRRRGLADDLLTAAGLIARFDARPRDYRSLFGFEQLHPLQRLTERIPFGVEPGAEMVIVEAPMGLGKTEIALFLAAMAIEHDNAHGVYFALPTQASANALLDRLQAFALNVAADGSTMSFALAHGARRFKKEYRSILERFERSRERAARYRDDVTPPSELIAPSWLQSSKRLLLSGVGLGTIDQAMLGAISAKHAFVRLFALADKVVVLDEIHAYDSYMNTVIIRLLEWLRLLGCKVILLSATLPRTFGNELIRSYGGEASTDGTDPALDPYPQIVHFMAGATARHYDIEGAEPDGRYKKPPVVIEPIAATMSDRTKVGAECALRLAADGGCVAWIRNTVREAQEAWRMLREMCGKDGPEIVILHARYTRYDRDRIESALVKILGKEAGQDRPRRMIVIATQVIEQSVDIDFDAMISDLAPIDLLLQRVGRLWRHPRPAEERYRHQRPVLHLLMPTPDELHKLELGASAYVYDAGTLARTATIVREGSVTWSMPEACRALVTELYDRPDAAWTSERLKVDPEILAKATTKLSAKDDTLKDKARKIILGIPTEDELPGMEFVLSDDEREEGLVFSTRHGSASATVVLFTLRDGEPRLLGAPDISLSPLPSTEDVPRVIRIEEGVLLSSVSFPCYEALQPSFSHAQLAPFDAWWRARHPYDRKVLLLLGADDAIEHPMLDGYYRGGDEATVGEGLTVKALARPKTKEADWLSGI